MDYLKDIERIIYETPEQLYLGFCPNIDFDDINDSEKDYEFNTTRKGAVDVIKRNGLWGFVDLDAKEIHVWADPQTKFTQILEFFGHEFGHFLEKSNVVSGEEFAKSCAALAHASFIAAHDLINAMLVDCPKKHSFGSEVKGLIHEG